ncbi:MAG: STAS domain-containing protein [Spirochaetia bacterium]
MELKLKRKGDIYIINIEGEMDLYNAEQLRNLFHKMVGKNVTKFVFNMEKVTYIDSSGIGTLINIYSVTRKKKLKMLLSNVSGTTLKVMELTKLAGFFPLAPSINDALRTLE